MDGALELREVDVLPLARAPAVVEGGDECEGADVRHEEVRIGDARADGLAVGPACQVVEAGCRLQGMAVSHVVRPGAGLAEEGHRDHDEVGADLAQLLVVEAELLERAGRERLRDDIRDGDKALEQLGAAGCFRLMVMPYLELLKFA